MSLKEALTGVKQGKSESESEQPNRKPQRPEKTLTANARALGKSSNDDYERLTVYVLKATKRDSSRKWEDATGKDMSDLVETLLSKYLST